VCLYTVSRVATTAMPISIGEDDYLAYRHGLGEALKESGCALHAYVLMSNPVHLLLTPPQPQDVPRLIISLGWR
jgi:putative transposase